MTIRAERFVEQGFDRVRVSLNQGDNMNRQWGRAFSVNCRN